MPPKAVVVEFAVSASFEPSRRLGIKLQNGTDRLPAKRTSRPGLLTDGGALDEDIGVISCAPDPDSEVEGLGRDRTEKRGRSLRSPGCVRKTGSEPVNAAWAVMRPLELESSPGIRAVGLLETAMRNPDRSLVASHAGRSLRAGFIPVQACRLDIWVQPLGLDRR